jgi:hypothetical protein
MKDLVKDEGTVSEADKARVKHETNPFWDLLEMDVHKRKIRLKGDNGPKAIVSLGTGEKEGVAEVYRVQEVDGDRFIKVYTRYLTVFFDMSKNAQKLFEFALYEAGRNKNKDTLFLHPKDADRYHKTMGRSGYSQASFYRAADELCGKEIFARSDVAGKFFINPAVFWNGDRVEFITELRKAPQIYGPGEVDPVGGDGVQWPEGDPHFTD